LETHAIPESVAYALLLAVAASEEKLNPETKAIQADRKWILDTFAECLDATSGKRTVVARFSTT